MAKYTTKNFDYRTKAAQLDQIVVALQNPDIQLDEATKLHEEGVTLIRELEEYLVQAETVVKKHTTES